MIRDFLRFPKRLAYGDVTKLDVTIPKPSQFVTLLAMLPAVMYLQPVAAQQSDPPVPAPAVPAPQASPVPPTTSAPPKVPNTNAQEDDDDALPSTSPVPLTSTLYPGSTVRSFRGKDNFGFRIESDFRYRSVTGQGEKSGTYLSATRLTGDWVRANPQNRDERGGVRLQAMMETDDQGTVIRRLRFAEAYGYYTFLSGGVSARARVGQFVIPFGLLAVYDTSLQPVQSIYEKALGLRVDTGVMLEGRYGAYRYAGSLTAGSGPNRTEFSQDAIVTFRLARSVTLPKIGPVEIGGSLLSGRLPETNFDTRLQPSGTVATQSVIKSTRFAADGQLFRDPWTFRGEVIFGANDKDPVFGYFAEADYRLNRQMSAVAYSKRWDFSDNPSRATALGLGASYTPSVGWNDRLHLTFRTLFEFERNVPETGQGSAKVYRRLTLQTFLLY